jgi:GT2 family glycosyltransferase
MNKRKNQEIHRIKKELGMLRAEKSYFSLPPIRPLISKRLPGRIIGKIRRELAKRQATSLFLPKGPSILTKLAARKVSAGLAFKHPKKPKVSIVIPIFNKFELTCGCLQSLIEHIPNSIAYEVVLVNNASSDDSHEYLSKIPGIAYVNNSENLGFVDGCNAGAKKAKGKYLVFLNNDTSITPGWLESLVSTIEDDETIGLVGSKLIFPSGTLQEAGGIIFNDGSGMNYGKHDHPGDYKYNYVREVDYCSGASIIIESKLFMKLGMFDRLYAPAYYEDTDLAFSVREAGLKVIYQPDSVAFHIEGATAGTSTSTGYKRFQEINHKKFLMKRKKELAEQYSPDKSYLARDRSSQKLVLIVDEHIPKTDEDAGSVRMFRIIESLISLGYKVTFFPNFTGYTGKHLKELQQIGVEVIYGPIEFNEFAREYAEYYNLIILSRPRIASYYIDICRVYAPESRIIYDTVDLHYLRMNRQAVYETGRSKDRLIELASKHEIIEKYLMRQADNTLVVSTAEKEILDNDGISNVSILSTIHTIQESSYEKGYSDRKDILFIGSYPHLPNIDAVKWFVSDIFPLIREKIPTVNIHVVGSGMKESLRTFLEDRPGVIVDGFVEDLSDLLNESRVFVAPLRFGAGVKGKIGQAVEHGIPIVSTNIGVEGMGFEDDKSCLIADDIDSFVEATVKLYSNQKLWESIRINARSNLVEQFSITKACEDIKDIVS